MTLKLADRVRETSTTEGVGPYTLLGNVSGFRTFASAIGGANQCSYVATMGSQFEVGYGVVGSGTLSRDTILTSSNGGAKVNWTAGTKDIRCDAVASWLVDLKPVLYGPFATTSGTSISVTGISANAQEIRVMLDLVGINGVDDLIIQLGDVGGFETTGYSSLSAEGEPAPTLDMELSTIGFKISQNQASTVQAHGVAELILSDPSTNTWIGKSLIASGSSKMCMGTVRKSLSSTLTQVRLTTGGGVTDFDEGSISVRVYT